MSDTGFYLNAQRKPQIDKAVPSELDYNFDWTDWLRPGDSINGTPSASVVGDADLEVDRVERTGNVVSCWLTGGTPGVTSELRCRIETAQGRTDEKTVFVRVVASRP